MRLVLIGSGVGGGGVGDGAPRNGLEFLGASTGVDWRVCLFFGLVTSVTHC